MQGSSFFLKSYKIIKKFGKYNIFNWKNPLENWKLWKFFFVFAFSFLNKNIISFTLNIILLSKERNIFFVVVDAASLFIIRLFYKIINKPSGLFITSWKFIEFFAFERVLEWFSLLQCDLVDQNIALLEYQR